MKVSFISLGCPKNRVDTERMMALCKAAGYEVVADETASDVAVLNTCAFIESAKRESIDNILDLAWLKQNKNLRAIVVAGCLSERYREQILQEMPEVDAVIGAGSFNKITDAVEAAARGVKYSDFAEVSGAPIGGERLLSTPEYSVYLKVADGCDNRCTYCAIPLIRGSFRSRPIDEIVEEAKKLERMGAVEINLIAQDTTRYGEDLYGAPRIVELLRRITGETSVPWIRLLYCYPDRVTDELIDEIASNPRIVKYIDLPIQHASDKILRSMNRRGDAAGIRALIAKLRAKIPGVTVRSTAIVGFPGESEEDFEELCRFVREVRFDRFGAFTYSREEDTPAADFDGQIDPQTAQDRYDILMGIQAEIAESNGKNKVGQIIELLVEGYDPAEKLYYGRSVADAPDIDTKVFFKASKKPKSGEFIRVRVTSAVDYDLVGEREN